MGKTKKPQKKKEKKMTYALVNHSPSLSALELSLVLPARQEHFNHTCAARFFFKVYVEQLEAN